MCAFVILAWAFIRLGLREATLETAMSTMWRKPMLVVGGIVAGIVVVSAFMGVMVPLFALYFCTLVGPLYHIYVATPREQAVLATITEVMGDVGFFNSSLGPIFYRWTVPPVVSKSTPVVLPGGLGATVINTCMLHDGLTRRGFRTLSFDRPGVGLSAASDVPLSPLDHVRIMDELLTHVAANEAFGMFAGSFGNTVAQLFTAKYPHRVAFCLNLDGLPFVFLLSFLF